MSYFRCLDGCHLKENDYHVGLGMLNACHSVVPDVFPISPILYTDVCLTVRAADLCAMCTGSVHGIDVNEEAKMYCLEVMQPNDMFAELVRAGMPAGALLDDDLCILIAAGCS